MENKEPLPQEDDKNIAELASDYVQTYVKLAVVNINLKIAEISSVASFSMIAGMLCLFIFMFLGIAAAYWVGELLNSTALGFLVVAGFFLLIFLVVFLSRKKLFYPLIKNIIIRSIYE